MDIKDQVALVTGGASGLGLATARVLVGRGAKVVLFDQPTAPGDAAIAELGDAASFVPGDVRDADTISAALDVAATLGTLRVVVNCAGIGIAHKTVGREGPFPIDVFERVLAVNLLGTFNVTRLAAERMIAAEEVNGERGVVVNTASVAAFDGQIGQVAYSASKGGVAGMTLPLARDLASSKIRVMTIAPGTFDTPMLQGVSEDVRESLGNQVPHPSRLGDPAEFGLLVADIVHNPMLNGEVIRLDGAIRMAPR